MASKLRGPSMTCRSSYVNMYGIKKHSTPVLAFYSHTIQSFIKGALFMGVARTAYLFSQQCWHNC